MLSASSGPVRSKAATPSNPRIATGHGMRGFEMSAEFFIDLSSKNPGIRAGACITTVIGHFMSDHNTHLARNNRPTPTSARGKREIAFLNAVGIVSQVTSAIRKETSRPVSSPASTRLPAKRQVLFESANIGLYGCL